MWPEKIEELDGRMKAVSAVAEKYERTLDYGLRVHMIVRETETEAREYADYIVSKLDDEYGHIRERALDSTSLGVAHQAKNRELADKFGYVEPHLWTGVGRARSGCGTCRICRSNPQQNRGYRKMGMRAFIFSAIHISKKQNILGNWSCLNYKHVHYRMNMGGCPIKPQKPL